MKLEKKTAEISGSIGLKNTKAKLSTEDMQKMYELIQEPYKNSIGAIVREYTSNAFDSHAEAKVDDAVIVKLGRNETLGYYIKFIDFGVGLSPDRMEHVFMNIFASTKEQSNDVIGCFGMGSKSGISYNPFFYINTHFDGTTYKYIYRKGKLEPELDLLEEYEESDRRNGSEFIVPIKDEYDLDKFVSECNRQLYYFKNVVFDIAELKNCLPSYEYENIEHVLHADYKIYEGENFKVRIHNNVKWYTQAFHNLHLSIGPVSYPIDSTNFDVPNHLNLSEIALKFDIGDLDIIQTREDVRYTEKTLDAIQNKLDAFKEEMLDIYGRDQLVIHTKFRDYADGLKEARSITLGKDDYTLIISTSLFPNRNHKLKAFYNIDKNYDVPLNLIESCYDGFKAGEYVKHSSAGLVRHTTADFYEWVYGIDSTEGIGIGQGMSLSNYKIKEILDNNVPIVFKDRDSSHSVKTNKQLIVKECDVKIGGGIAIFNGKEPNYLDHYKFTLNLNDVSKDKWRPIIKTYKAIREKVLKSFKSNPYVFQYEDIKVDEKWLAEYNKKYRKTSTRDNTKISIIERNSTWDSDNVSMHDLMNTKGVVIYTDKDTKDDLLLYRDFTFRGSSHKHREYKRFIAVSKTNVKKIANYVKENDITTVMSLEEYKDNKNNMAFKNLTDLYVYLKYKQELRFIEDIFNKTRTYNYIKLYYPKVYSKIEYLVKYEQEVSDKFKTFRDNQLNELVNDVEGLAEFAEMKKHDTITTIKDIDMFLNYNKPLIILLEHSQGYYSSFNIKSDILHLIHLSLVNQKLVDTNFVMQDSMAANIDKLEYELLLDQATKDEMVENEGYTNRITDWTDEEKQAAFLINKYEILNKQKLTKWNL